VSDPTPPKSPWHAFRRAGITGTDAAALMGRGRASPLSVYLDKKGLLPEVEENEAMYWGTRLEPLLVEEFMRRTPYQRIVVHQPEDGHEFRLLHPLDEQGQRRMVMFRRDEPWARCTPDAFYMRPGTGPLERLGILECKTTGFRGADAWQEQPPLPAQVQLQWNLYVSGLKHGALVCLIGGQRFVGYEMERNDRFLEHLRGEAFRFWEENILGDKQPEPGPDDLDLVRVRSRPENGTTITLPPEAATLDQDLLQAKEDLADATARVDGIEAKLIQMLGHASFGEIPELDVRYSYHTQQRGDTEFRTLRRRQMK